MRFRTRLRTSAATIALILLLPTVFIYGVDLQQWVIPGYWASASGQVSFGLTFIAPTCGACAAWEAYRLRKGGIFGWSAVRHPLRIAWDSVVIVVLLGVAGLISGIVAIWPAVSGAPSGPSPLIALTWISVILGHTAWGFILGHFFPLPIAFPTAAAAGYVWMAYPATLEQAWPRHLNGRSLDSCCGLFQEPSARVVAGVCVLAIGFLVAVAAIVAGGARVRTFAIAFTVFASAATGGFLLVRPMGTEAVQNRSSGLTCSGAAPRICLWPEQAKNSTLIRNQLRTSYGVLTGAGIPLPATLSSGRYGKNSLWVRFAAKPTRQEVVMGFAGSLLPGGPPACARNAPYDGFEAYGPSLAWLGLLLDAKPIPQPGRLSPYDWALADRIRTLPLDQQLSWYTTNRQALVTCGRTPVLVPDALIQPTSGGKP